MSLAYFDCFAGAGGDMIVGSLIDAGADADQIAKQLATLGVHGLSVSCEKVNRGGMTGTKFNVAENHVHHSHDHGEHCAGHNHHRNLGDILEIIDRASLPPRADARTTKIFTRLAEAEAKVHGIPVDQVHFHEVGAIDSICDIIGACLAMELLDIDRIICSPIPLGSGFVQTAHGKLPVPAPATTQLLIGATTCKSELAGEIITPTAAAILTTLAESYGPAPSMSVSGVGYGAGSYNQGPIPNLLCVFIGQASEAGQIDSVVELSANIDDCTGEIIGDTIEKLLLAGCLDAWASPIYMKKNRPAWTLSAICNMNDVSEVESIFFRNTTTFGVRRQTCARRRLDRSHVTVQTPYGPIRVKVGKLDGKVVSASPEFADCAAAADSHGVATKTVYTAAQAGCPASRNETEAC